MTTTATTASDTASVHPVIFLKDYQPPAFQVESIGLTIQIFDHETLVESTLAMRRDHPGPCVLFGRDLELLSIHCDDKELLPSSYTLDKESLTLEHIPDQCEIRTRVRIHPETNTQLEGLYLAETLFVTQNEPEGFRKITYFPDRPDVLSVYTTRLEADRKYPTLLANGNLLEKGELPENRHFAVWHDPTRKPSYLFACVAGNLDVLRDTFTTMEGKTVDLEIYTESRDIAKCHVAMQALKDSMAWDEQHYGRCYDLDNYMIVAVSQFNMGAMENKGLNIFNTACVLSDPETTTDPSNFYVKSTIAHEYFHNWTGNRITCRDWFQLCLKEGFTVFRDQSFSDTLQSPAVQRIDDVSSLKSVQFAEDAGPMSHPPRPDHFVEINNFYTATVYDKGAEIIRMMANYLGPEAYRRGTDVYFADHDGKAVTVEDLIQSLSRGSGVDLSAFLQWYNQPGTPCLKGVGRFDPAQQRYFLTLRQETPSKPNYPAPKPLPIPVALALFDKASGEIQHEAMLLLDQAEQQFDFPCANEPVLSLLRDFSAPVLVDVAYSDDDLAFLLHHETNGFNQWQASQLLLERILLEQHPATVWLDAMAYTMPEVASRDPLLASRLLDVPTENYLASRIDNQYDPDVIHERREALLNALSKRLQDFWLEAYQDLPIVHYQDTSLAMGQRAWRNAVLAMLFRCGNDQAEALALSQYQTASCMTERLGALRQLVWNQSSHAASLLDDFRNRFEQEALAMDLWFGVQAGNPATTAADARLLTQHPLFDLRTPNRIRSVTGNFAANPVQVWTPDGMAFYANLAKILDEKNPVLGSRQLQVLSRWYTLKEPLRQQALEILQGLKTQLHSSSLVETLTNLLKMQS